MGVKEKETSFYQFQSGMTKGLYRDWSVCNEGFKVVVTDCQNKYFKPPKCVEYGSVILSVILNSIAGNFYLAKNALTSHDTKTEY